MGHSDSRLTSHGIVIAGAMVPLLQAEGIGAIFSSSLGRAAFTAAIYAEALGLPIFFRESMAELSCGTWEGRSRSEVTRGSGVLRRSWMDRPPDGESYHDGEERVGRFIEEIQSEDRYPAILVVGHASVNRVLLKLLLGLDEAEALTVACPHHTIYLLSVGDEVRHKNVQRIEGNGLLFDAH